MLKNDDHNEDGDGETTPLQDALKNPVTDEVNDKIKLEQSINKSDTLYLIFSVITGELLILTVGSYYVWPSSAIVQLKSKDIHINPLGRQITTLEISMLTAIPLFLSISGNFFFPLLADKIGRKRCLQVTAIGMLLNGVALAYSSNILLMVTFFSGISICYAGSMVNVSVYITEICEDHNRAKYGCLMGAFPPLGQLYAYIVGPLFTIKYATLIFNIPLIIFLVLIFFAPESPVYFLSSGGKEQCIKAIRKLRNNKTSSEIEVDYNKISKSLSESTEKKSNFMKMFKTKEGRVGMALASIQIFAQYFSGLPLLLPLMAPIFNETGISISGSTIAVMVGILKVVMCIITSFIVGKTGKKTMLLISSAGASIPVSTLGWFFYLRYINSPIAMNFQWVPIISILSFAFFYSIGLGIIPYATIGEFFPPDIRSSAISFITTITSMLLAIYSFVFPLFADMVGTHWCMWIFGITNMISAVSIYLFIPKTDGKSIQEIQEMLKNYKLIKT